MTVDVGADVELLKGQAQKYGACGATLKAYKAKA